MQTNVRILGGCDCNIESMTNDDKDNTVYLHVHLPPNGTVTFSGFDTKLNQVLVSTEPFTHPTDEGVECEQKRST